MTIDNIIEQKVKFGPAQYISLIFLCLVDMNDGAQLVLSSFITPVIKQQWNLDPGTVSMLASIFYLGIFSGSIISGKLSDKHGRKPIILIGTGLTFIFSILFVFANSVTFMTLIRFGYGFSFGSTIALTTSMYAQSSPIKYRGKSVLLLNFCLSSGKVFSIVLAQIFLDSYTTGNWRLMMLCSSVLSLIILIGGYFYMEESPRYLIANQKYQEAFDVLDRMILKNNINQPFKNPELITEKQKKEIIEWRNQIFKDKQPATFKSLFDKQYLIVTSTLAICWFTANFNYYGQLTVLPFIFGKEDKSFASYILTLLGQAPSFMLSLYLIDKPHFGRKKSLIYFFILSAIFNFMFSFNQLILVSSICRFFMKECFQMLYPCTTESYGTFNRTLGFGFCSAMGRLGAFIMPYIILPLVEINQSFIFMIFGVLALLGAISSFYIPRQPMDRPLDEKFTPAIQMNELKKNLI